MIGVTNVRLKGNLISFVFVLINDKCEARVEHWPIRRIYVRKRSQARHEGYLESSLAPAAALSKFGGVARATRFHQLGLCTV